MDNYNFIIDKCNRRSFFLFDLLKKDGYEVSEYKQAYENNSFYTNVYIFSPTKCVDISDKPFIKRDSIIFAGKMDKDLCDELNLNFIPIMKDELYVYYNSIITAEGAMQLAMTSTDRAIYDEYVLVLGYGRLGKAVSKIFLGKARGVGVATYDINEYHSAGNNFITYFGTSFLNNIRDYDVVINTIPSEIIDCDDIKYISKDCLFIDLASKGIITKEALQEIEFNYMPALQLPDKVAPKTAAYELKKSLMRALKNLNKPY